MKQLQLVTHTQAEKLRSAGFDWECSSYYDYGSIAHGESRNWNAPTPFFHASAPSIALALKWMRDEKGIVNAIGIKSDSVKPETPDVYFETFYKSWGTCEIDGSTWFDTYEEAETALLDELLTILGK